MLNRNTYRGIERSGNSRSEVESWISTGVIFDMDLAHPEPLQLQHGPSLFASPQRPQRMEDLDSERVSSSTPQSAQKIEGLDSSRITWNTSAATIDLEAVSSSS